MLIASALPMNRFLLLEDDPHYRGILERVLLRSESCAVTSVATEAQAWEVLSREEFDLVLLDLHIDGRCCWETLKRVVHRPGRHSAIVLSCDDTRENADRARSLGAFAFLPKPIDFARLKSTVDSALRGETREAPPKAAPPGEGTPLVGVS